MSRGVKMACVSQDDEGWVRGRRGKEVGELGSAGRNKGVWMWRGGVAVQSSGQSCPDPITSGIINRCDPVLKVIIVIQGYNIGHISAVN